MPKIKTFIATLQQKSLLLSVSTAIAKSTQRLHNTNSRNNINDAEVIAEIILTAFSIEALLKSFHTHTNPNREYLSGHNLKELFDYMPPNIKQGIAESFFNLNKKEKDLDTFLSEHANIFVDWRYIWEANPAKSYQVNLSQMRIFMNLLSRIMETMK